MDFGGHVTVNRKKNDLAYVEDGKNGRMTEVDVNGNIKGFVSGDIFKRAHGMAITSKGNVILALKDGRIEMVSKIIYK